MRSGLPLDSARTPSTGPSSRARMRRRTGVAVINVTLPEAAAREASASMTCGLLVGWLRGTDWPALASGCPNFTPCSVNQW